MSEQLREALSAIVDGEASNFELRRVLDEISKDESLQTTWHNYHLMRSAMQGENTVNVSGMSDRIWAELDFENVSDGDVEPEMPIEAQIAEQPKRRWGVALGSGAIAAAVATVLLVGGYLPGSGPDTAASQVAQETGSVPVVNDDVQLADFTRALDDEDQSQFVTNTGNAAQADDVDYGPGFISLADMTPQQRAHAEGRFMRHVQQRGMNNSNLLNFTKMIAFQK